MSSRLESGDSLKQIGQVVRETIDQSMKDLLGAQGAESTFIHIKLVDYDKKPNEFHLRLTSIFKQGSAIIEKMIIKDLYKRLNVPLEGLPDFSYEEAVAHAMRYVRERAVKGGVV